MNNEELQNRIVENVQNKIAIFEFKKEDKKKIGRASCRERVCQYV